MPKTIKGRTSRDELLKALQKDNISGIQKEVAKLRLEYSDIHTLRSTFLECLRYSERINPVILPTQASGRWSYIDPPLSGFPKRCINPECSKKVHRKTDTCWSIRDCIRPDKNTFWIEHDLDAVEHRIYCLILDWKERLTDLRSGKEIHTPVTCTLFNLPMCSNVYNPHTSEEDEKWRQEVGWNGKDDSRRTISKNFTYGQGQYAYVYLKNKYSKRAVKLPYREYKGLVYTPEVVYLIPNIESYLIKDKETGELRRPDYINLAIKFMEDNVEIQSRKAVEMEVIRKDKIARTLYGGRRLFYFSNQNTAKQGFNHRIQGTVASYINESCILLQKEFPDSYLVQNKHDSLSWCFIYESSSVQGRKEEEEQILQVYKSITQRELVYKSNSIPITATFKVIRREV